MFESDVTTTTAVTKPGTGLTPLTLSEVVRHIERRLAWYGLPRSGLRALEVRGVESVVATVTVAGNGTFREEFDRQTGCMRRRERLPRAA